VDVEGRSALGVRAPVVAAPGVAAAAPAGTRAASGESAVASSAAALVSVRGVPASTGARGARRRRGATAVPVLGSAGAPVMLDVSLFESSPAAGWARPGEVCAQGMHRAATSDATDIAAA
jgi:hypothetical protein